MRPPCTRTPGLVVRGLRGFLSAGGGGAAAAGGGAEAAAGPAAADDGGAAGGIRGELCVCVEGGDARRVSLARRGVSCFFFLLAGAALLFQNHTNLPLRVKTTLTLG